MDPADSRSTAGTGLLVAPTEKLMAEIVEPQLRRLALWADPRVVDLLRQPLGEILSDVDSSDKDLAGLALEALAFKLMRILDMDYAGTRLRGAQTGGTEAGLIFRSNRLVLNRWQIQCKNSARMSIDDVAKEVGLTHVLRGNVIVVVTTGTVDARARRYAKRVMADSSLAVVLIDGRDLKTLARRPTRIVHIFKREARHALELKKLDEVAEQNSRRSAPSLRDGAPESDRT